MAYGVSKFPPYYGVGAYNGFSEIFDVNKNQWYQSPSVFSDDCNTTANWTAVSGAVLSVVDGSIKIVDGSPWLSGMSKVINTVVGKKYMFTYYNHGAWDTYPTVDGVFYTITAGLGTKQITFVASAVTTTIGFNTGSGIDRADMMVDNIAVYPINNDGSVDISGATPITNSRNYLNAIVYADAGGQPTYVEQLPKIRYEDAMQVNSLNVLGGFDLGQTWVNETANRLKNVTYRNEEEKTIYIYVRVVSSAANETCAILVDSIEVSICQAYAAGVQMSLYAPIPPNSLYTIITNGTIGQFKEMK